MNELLTMKEVTEYLKVSRMAIYTWMKAGKLKGYKVGRSVRFKRSDIEDFIKEWGVK